MNVHNPIEQRKTKPKIEDVLPIYLDGDSLKNATDFVAFLREHKMSPGWRSPNSWCSNYKGKVVAYIKLGESAYQNSKSDFWQIVFQNHYNDESKALFDEHTIKIVWSKIRFCTCCADFSCAPGVRGTILGKELDSNVCRHMSLLFNNPDTDELKCVKKLALSSKKIFL